MQNVYHYCQFLQVPRDCTGEIPDEAFAANQSDSTENEPGVNGDDSDDDSKASPESEDGTPSHTPSAAAVSVGASGAFDSEVK